MKKSKYKVLSHTADLRLEVYGETLEELFKNAAEALADILSTKDAGVGDGGLEKVKVESLNKNTLLVDFLNEILAKSHINKKIYKISNIKIQISNGKNIAETELIGCPVEGFDEDIKAATYHEVDIKQKDGIWQTKLILDI